MSIMSIMSIMLIVSRVEYGFAHLLEWVRFSTRFPPPQTQHYTEETNRGVVRVNMGVVCVCAKCLWMAGMCRFDGMGRIGGWVLTGKQLCVNAQTLKKNTKKEGSFTEQPSFGAQGKGARAHACMHPCTPCSKSAILNHLQGSFRAMQST